MEPEYDVVVAGGGTGGATAAYLIAREGLDVALIDMNPRDLIGLKVCGDAIDSRHFDALGIPHPSGAESEGEFVGVKVFAPNEEDHLVVGGRGYALNRHAFGQRMIRMAESEGAEVFAEHHAVAPLTEGNRVVGVEVRDLRSGEAKRFRAKITVDATGVTAKLRTSLPGGWWVSGRPPREDYNVAFRENLVVEEVPERERGYAVIYLSQSIAPGGYWWSFHKGGNRLNVGIGVQWREGNPNPRERYYGEVRPRYRVSEVIHAGGGIVPTRRPIPCMAWHGFMALGDAICAANPIHGGGIGPSMLSARAAAETAVEALSEGDWSLRRLWGYHKRYHALYGAKQAGLDVLRMYMQRLSDDDLNFLISSGVVTGEDVYDFGSRGRLSGELVGRISAGLRLLRRPSILGQLRRLKDYMDAAISLYGEFPDSPEGFESWRAREASLFEEVEGWLGSL